MTHTSSDAVGRCGPPLDRDVEAKTTSQANWRPWLQKADDWRVDLVFRVCGWSIFVAPMGAKAEALFAGRVSFAMCVGSAMMLIGFRPIVALLSAIATTGYVLEINFELGFTPTQQVEEHQLWLCYLWGSWILWILSRWRGPKDVQATEAAMLHWTRLLISGSLVFITLSKINTDFFDATVSCVNGFATHVATNFPLPQAWLSFSPGEWLTPLLVMATEGAIVVLLWTAPVIGIPFTIAAMVLIGLAGALPYVAMFIGGAAAFYHRDDGARLASALRRHWLMAAIGAASACVLFHLTYQGSHIRLPWHLGVAISSGLAMASLVILWAALRAARPWRALDALWRLTSCWQRVAVSLLAAVLIASGLSPYLGWKSRYSFSMVANLRVDKTRWNSYIFPQWMYLPKHDPYVRVHAVKTQLEADAPKLESLRLDRKMYAPSDFLFGAYYLIAHAAQFEIELEYHDQRYVFDHTQRAALQDFVAALPLSRLYQTPLTLSGPQVCIH